MNEIQMLVHTINALSAAAAVGFAREDTDCVVNRLLSPYFPVQQYRHKHPQCPCYAPVLELARPVLPAMDGAKCHDVRWLPADRFKFLPVRLLRL